MTKRAPDGVDATTPNGARIYDYLLGGTDNYAADRAAAGHLLAEIPYIGAVARDNRAFLTRAVRYLAAAEGISQFLDLGGGLPTRSNVHEVARAIKPDARVAYVDYDPVVAKHGQALLAGLDGVAMAHADLTDPASVLDHPDVRAVLDLTEPVALICTATLHFIPAEAHPYQIVAAYRERVASGSFLALSHAPTPDHDPNHDAGHATEVYRSASAQLHLRTQGEIERFFDGFDLIEPGVVVMPRWRPDPDDRAESPLRSLRAGVGRKP